MALFPTITSSRKKTFSTPAQTTDSSHHSWLSRLAIAAIATTCVSISTTAWSDTQSFDFSGFDGLSAAEGIHLHVTAGEVFKVTAESEDARQLDHLDLDVQRGTLRAEMDNGLMSPKWVTGEKVTVRVTMPSLIKAETLSGAEIVAQTMRGPDLKLASSSGSRLRIETIDGGTLSVQLSSGANIQITDGTCTSLSADVSGGSSLGMANVACAKVDVDANSGSAVSVHAGSIEGHASGGAKIHVYGAHARAEIEVSGGGSVDFP